MKESFTLKDVISGEVELPSTKIVPLETPRESIRNGSMPYYLYLAIAAKIMMEMGKKKMNPSLYIKESGHYDKNATADLNREIKRRLLKEGEITENIIDAANDSAKGDFSKILQARLIRWVTSSHTDFNEDDYLTREKDSINAGKGIPMLTIPTSIMVPLIFFLGTEKNARIYVIQVAKTLFSELKHEQSKKRTWSRTIHNQLIHDLIEWHRTPEEILRPIPSLNNISLPVSLLK